MLLAIFALVAMASPASARPRDTVNKSGEILTQEEIDSARAEAEAEYAKIPKAPADAEPLPPGPAIIQEVYPSESRFLDVPTHRQQTGYWCGPASILAMIDDFGRLGNVSGSTEQAKQQTIATQSGTTTQGSYTPSLQQTLNSYVRDVRTYQVGTVDSYSGDYNYFWNICYDRIISAGTPICVLVKTSYLPYYGGTAYYHYVVVDGMTVWRNDFNGQIERSISTVRIVDPHYSDSYFGYHTVLWTDLLNAAAGYYIPPVDCQAFNLIW